MIDLLKRVKKQTHKLSADDYKPLSECLQTDSCGINQLVSTPPPTYTDTNYDVFSVHNLLDNNPNLLREVGTLHIDNVDAVNNYIDAVTERMINDSNNNNIVNNG